MLRNFTRTNPRRFPGVTCCRSSTRNRSAPTFTSIPFLSRVACIEAITDLSETLESYHVRQPQPRGVASRHPHVAPRRTSSHVARGTSWHVARRPRLWHATCPTSHMKTNHFQKLQCWQLGDRL